MQTGMTLQQLAAELDSKIARKHDLLADSRSMTVALTDEDDGPRLPRLCVGDEPPMAIRDHAHGQIAQRLDIPKRYYDRMKTQAPELFAESLNTWLGQSDGRRLIRAMLPGEGQLITEVRAVLSDRYRRVENEQVFRACVQAFDGVADQYGLQVRSTGLTETRMHLTVTLPGLEREVRAGDVVRAGITVRNSEIGHGALEAVPMMWRCVCDNGMVVPKAITAAGLRKTHVGRQLEMAEDFSVYTDETVAADDRALMLKVRDVMRHLASPEVWDAIARAMRAAAESEPVQDPVKAVETLRTVTGINEGACSQLLQNFIREGDMTKWGMANAVTALAHDAEQSYERAVEYTELGGSIITLGRNDWHRIATAA